MTRSPIALAALATLAVPGLDVVATRPPVRTTSDYQTVGLLDSRGRHWVVRVPRTAAAGAGMEAEIALLEILAGHVDAHELPFEVQRPAGFTPLKEGGRAMVARDLPGRPADPSDIDADPRLAHHLGTALAALHSLPTDVVADVGLPVYDIPAYRRRRLAEVDEAARTGDVPPELLNRWEAALEDDSLWPGAPAVVHGDLDAEHVRVADGRVAALTHLDEAHVGDPAEDLAWLAASVEPDTLDAVEAAYRAAGRPEDPYLLDRAQLVSELLLVRWLMYGRRTGDEAVLRDARHMLLDLATDLTEHPLIGSHTKDLLAAGRTTVAHPGAETDPDDHWEWSEDEDGGAPVPDAEEAEDGEVGDDGEDLWPESGPGALPHGVLPHDPLPDDALLDDPELDAEAWPSYDAHPGESPHVPGVPEPTAATADLSEEYEQWRREGREP